MPTDYCNKDNWLAAPGNPAKNVDVFFAYPTAWRAEAGAYPVSRIDNPGMRHRAKHYLAAHASVFKSCANIFAPYCRRRECFDRFKGFFPCAAGVAPRISLRTIQISVSAKHIRIIGSTIFFVCYGEFYRE
ncbi:MAG: DUF3089 domain-containing protein [Desulfovibrio sp.]|nr:DUF3089 domain-containing protein [Desulfovibrio sp.]